MPETGHFISMFNHPPAAVLPEPKTEPEPALEPKQTAPTLEPEQPEPLTLRAQTLTSLPWRTASDRRFPSTEHLLRWLKSLAD
jgi:hypothetical protein